MALQIAPALFDVVELVSERWALCASRGPKDRDHMLTSQLSAAIGVAPLRSLDDLSRDVWRALSGGLLTDDDAQRLAETIHERRINLRSSPQEPSGASGTASAPRSRSFGHTSLRSALSGLQIARDHLSAGGLSRRLLPCLRSLPLGLPSENRRSWGSSRMRCERRARVF
jgi:hypothetical protein